MKHEVSFNIFHNNFQIGKVMQIKKMFFVDTNHKRMVKGENYFNRSILL